MMVLLALSGGDLKLALERFTAKCKMVEIGQQFLFDPEWTLHMFAASDLEVLILKWKSIGISGSF